tara:strand:+ start:42 stop:254 length:213 start_codon:yes stop_codon:yes gene_type:complete
MGFYNEYIFGNNSYLSIYVVRQTVEKNGNCKNINKLIEKALNKIYYDKYLKVIKSKVKNKSKYIFKNVTS